MTKQEELFEGARETISDCVYGLAKAPMSSEEITAEVFKYLDSRGVVLKVERELPNECGFCSYLKDDNGFDTSIHNWVCLNPNGKCVAVESILVKEKR